MCGVIAVAFIQRRKGKPQQWNGVERRTMEKIADAAAEAKVNLHARDCPMWEELKQFRNHTEQDFKDTRTMIERELQAIRTLIFNLRQQP